MSKVVVVRVGDVVGYYEGKIFIEGVRSWEGFKERLYCEDDFLLSVVKLYCRDVKRIFIEVDLIKKWVMEKLEKEVK